MNATRVAHVSGLEVLARADKIFSSIDVTDITLWR